MAALGFGPPPLGRGPDAIPLNQTRVKNGPVASLATWKSRVLYRKKVVTVVIHMLIACVKTVQPAFYNKNLRENSLNTLTQLTPENDRLHFQFTCLTGIYLIILYSKSWLSVHLPHWALFNHFIQQTLAFCSLASLGIYINRKSTTSDLTFEKIRRLKL